MEGDPQKHSRNGSGSHFNPLPPHGGRLRLLRHASGLSAISIHSLRMEGDAISASVNFRSISFQSTPSAWRETRLHAAVVANSFHFNPLPPHGGRLQQFPHHHQNRGISIHSLRMEGDLTEDGRRTFLRISIHSLRMEGDAGDNRQRGAKKIFQSTPSAWRET